MAVKHAIFRDRHILVLDTDTNYTWKFDEKSLARMGCLDTSRQVQCKNFTSPFYDLQLNLTIR